MRTWTLAAFSIAVSQLVLADPTIQQAQQVLKQQGYYYGDISGEKDADTTAAIRRFQIRNGLQVTGELNDETRRALKADTASARTETATPPAQAGDVRENTPEQPIPARPINPPPAPEQVYPRLPGEPSGVFANTPYHTAPPELQRQVVLGAESLLRRRGLYKGPIDGVFGPELQFALRAYQSRIGLAPTGRFDMATLASLGLLPGQRPLERPRGRAFPAPADEPPVRGEWMH